MQPTTHEAAGESSPVPKAPLLLIPLFLAAVAGVALLYYLNHSEELKRQQQEALLAISDVKVGEIADWLRERRDDAEVTVSNPMIARSVRQALEGRPEAVAELRNWLRTVAGNSDYSDAFVLDGAGREVMAARKREPQVTTPQLAATVAEASRTGRVTMSDLYRDEASGQVYMDLAIPVLPAGAGTAPIGAIVLRIDPNRFLYPFVQSWPTASASAETLLVRREGGQVVFLNELRHQKNSALRLKLPLGRPRLPAAFGALGKEGLIEGIDYRGVPVLAVVRRIPGSNWILVTKVNTQEVYRPIRERGWWVVTTAGLVFAGLGLGVLLLFRHEQARFYRRQYEAELRRKVLERHYEHLNRLANDIFLLMDASGRIVEANDRAVSSYGYARNELLELHIRDLRAPEALPALEGQWEAVARGSGLVFETEHRRKDGSTFPVEVSSRSIEVEGSRFHQSIIRDITERKRAEEALREAHDNLRALIETCPGAIMVIDLERRVKLWSPAATRMFGWSEAEVLNQPLPIVPEEERASSEELLERTRSGESVLDFETRRCTKDGAIRDVSIWTAPLRDAQGAITGYFELCNDITDRKRLDDQLRHTQRLESIGLLAGGIAHDFNNILTSVLGYASLLREDLAPESRVQPYVEAVIQGAERAADLTMQLLAYAGKGRFVIEAVNLSELTREMSRLLQGSIPRNVELRLDLDETVPLVEADRSQMQQLIMNLAINGAEAIGDSVGVVRVAIGACELRDGADRRDFPELAGGTHVCLEVSDNGCGMDEETRSRIFDPFFTTKMMGRGLGLSAVLGIVRGHRGAIRISSEPGRGSTFRVLLPASKTPVLRPEPSLAAGRRGSGTVLVVDDEPAVRSLAQEALERRGYAVLLAANGKEALELVNCHAELSVVLLDMTMPVMSGEATLQAIRSRSTALPVVLCSGYSELEAARRFSGNHVSGFLQKPFTADQLVAKIAEAARTRGPYTPGATHG
ncbi:MAG: PAS domain S-box protein [Bryobacteraceae bacterium]|jgi:PAS domain S-box-containing protein